MGFLFSIYNWELFSQILEGIIFPFWNNERENISHKAEHEWDCFSPSPPTQSPNTHPNLPKTPTPKYLSQPSQVPIPILPTNHPNPPPKPILTPPNYPSQPSQITIQTIPNIYLNLPNTHPSTPNPLTSATVGVNSIKIVDNVLFVAKPPGWN